MIVWGVKDEVFNNGDLIFGFFLYYLFLGYDSVFINFDIFYICLFVYFFFIWFIWKYIRLYVSIIMCFFYIF